MTFLIWTYLLISFVFMWQFFMNPIYEDDVVIARYGSTIHGVFVTLVAFLWPVLLPLTIIGKIWKSRRS